MGLVVLGLRGRISQSIQFLLISIVLHGFIFLSLWGLPAMNDFVKVSRQEVLDINIVKNPSGAKKAGLKKSLMKNQKSVAGLAKETSLISRSSVKTPQTGLTHNSSLAKDQSEKLKAELFSSGLSVGSLTSSDDYKNYRQQKSNSVTGELPKSDWEYAPWGDGAGEFNRILQSNLFDQFFREVDRALFYPGILARHRIEAVVLARVILNQDGECDWQKTKIRSNDKHLQVFILDVLKKACKTDYSRWMASRENTLIDLSFEFQLTEHGNKELAQEKQFIVGNSLHLYRNAQKSVAEWHLGPVMGVFPLPMVSLDYGWLQENYERYIEKHDPMKKFEAEAPREHLNF